MTINIIVAYDSNLAIGRNNELMWHLSADLAHFKKITTNHCVIMGRKTYDSIGRPLPNRRNIVVSRNDGLVISGCEVVSSLEAALALVNVDEEVFVIGGAEIYHQALPLVDVVYATEVDCECEGADAFFPKLNLEEWKEVSRNKHLKGEKNPYNFTFVKYIRRSKQLKDENN